MNIDELVKRISKTDGLSKTLGMHFISTPEPDTLQASMKVDERNRQPFGFLRNFYFLLIINYKLLTINYKLLTVNYFLITFFVLVISKR